MEGNSRAMPQVSSREFEALPLRAHTFLAGVPLHDAWVVELPWTRSGITLDAFLRAAGNGIFRPSRSVRTLLGIRFFVGRLFDWDRESAASSGETFTARLTDDDRARSLVSAGTREGLFRVVYRFENEQLVELVNRTAHAGALTALFETTSSYRLYFGVYVRSIGRFTPLYMALIGPFRKLVVYPSLLRGVRAIWDQTVGTRRSGE